MGGIYRAHQSNATESKLLLSSTPCQAFLRVVFIIALSLCSHALEAGKISQALMEDLAKAKAERFVLVFLKEQAKLEEQEFDSREKRLAYIYDELTSHALKSQKSLREFLELKNADYRPFYITNAILLYNPSKELVEEISERDDVNKVSLDPYFNKKPLFWWLPFFGADFVSDEIESNLKAIGVDRVWKSFGIKGQGIVVASQDSGIQWDHPALVRQYRGTKNLFEAEHDYHWHDAIQRRNNRNSRNSCGYAMATPCDDGGHGTHTLGTILGNEGVNKIGVAPDAKWVACRNMDDGDGRPSTYIDCFEFFLAPYPYQGDPFTDGRPELAPHIINNSWGCPKSEGCEGFEMKEVFDHLKFAGIMLVASAGNDGPKCKTINSQPSSHQSNVLTVGAVDHRFNIIATFSSRGPSLYDGSIGPSVVAPGVNIRSSVPNDDYEDDWDGTSMAAPHVTGLVALLWSARPDLIGDFEKTKELIEGTATQIVSRRRCGTTRGAIPNNTYGYGMINAFEAVSRALTE